MATAATACYVKLKVLQPELIQTAFRKTGIVPFDRTVVTTDMMAPSRETSYKVYTPIVPSTPVRIVTDLLVDAIQAPVPSELPFLSSPRLTHASSHLNPQSNPHPPFLKCLH
ncbi:hypothetical protein BDZ97DRAFT_1818220 [Flammula alnicola]|nr:hypothetical protein BDZ97DRAFT_1818220 [Flammula alnicola]